jgi:hypothetical protein
MFYAAIQTGVAAAYTWAVYTSGREGLGGMDLADLLKENRFLEWVQIGVLVAAGAVCWPALRRRGFALHGILGLLLLAATFRELDSFLNDVLFDDAEKVLMFSALGAAALVFFLRFAEARDQVIRFSDRHGFFLLFFGAMLVTVFAQFFGQRELWKLLANPKLTSEAKRFVEEGLEFMGYLVIACGVIEERFFGGSSGKDSSGNPGEDTPA